MSAVRDPYADDLPLIVVGFVSALVVVILGGVWVRRRLW